MAAAVEEAGVGEVDGNEFGGGEAVLYAYGPEADALFKVMESTLRGLPFKPAHVVLRRGDIDLLVVPYACQILRGATGNSGERYERVRSSNPDRRRSAQQLPPEHPRLPAERAESSIADRYPRNAGRGTDEGRGDRRWATTLGSAARTATASHSAWPHAVTGWLAVMAD